jgi:hypothetical protein
MSYFLLMGVVVCGALKIVSGNLRLTIFGNSLGLKPEGASNTYVAWNNAQRRVEILK